MIVNIYVNKASNKFLLQAVCLLMSVCSPLLHLVLPSILLLIRSINLFSFSDSLLFVLIFFLLLFSLSLLPSFFLFFLLYSFFNHLSPYLPIFIYFFFHFSPPFLSLPLSIYGPLSLSLFLTWLKFCFAIKFCRIHMGRLRDDGDRKQHILFKPPNYY